MENQPTLKKGNLIFLSTLMVDLIYVVKCQEGEEVVARKLDSPPESWEHLPLSHCIKMAEEQERILPIDVMGAIERQREIIFTPPKPPSSKKSRKGDDERQMKLMLKQLPKEGLEEILDLLAKSGIEKEEGGE
jgi:hypothetical protein